MEKIYKELAEFRNFKSTYEFEQKNIEEIDGIEFVDGEPLINEEGEKVGECEKWINVGYKYKGPYSKILSNLFPYEFEFRGKKLSSIESFFQGIKFKDIEMQNLVLNYSRLDSNNAKECSNYDWKEKGIVYFVQFASFGKQRIELFRAGIFHRQVGSLHFRKHKPDKRYFYRTSGFARPAQRSMGEKML